MASIFAFMFGFDLSSDLFGSLRKWSKFDVRLDFVHGQEKEDLAQSRTPAAGHDPGAESQPRQAAFKGTGMDMRSLWKYWSWYKICDACGAGCAAVAKWNLVGQGLHGVYYTVRK